MSATKILWGQIALVFLIVGATKHDWKEALLFGLSVAVGRTPEMLPMFTIRP